MVRISAGKNFKLNLLIFYVILIINISSILFYVEICVTTSDFLPTRIFSVLQSKQL